jgi:hypothetical protein
MPRVKPITLLITYCAASGLSLVCSTAFAQPLNAGPTPPPPPGPHPISQPVPHPPPHPRPHPDSTLVPHPHSEPDALRFAVAVAGARCPTGRCGNTNPGT